MRESPKAKRKPRRAAQFQAVSFHETPLATHLCFLHRTHSSSAKTPDVRCGTSTEAATQASGPLSCYRYLAKPRDASRTPLAPALPSGTARRVSFPPEPPHSSMHIGMPMVPASRISSCCRPKHLWFYYSVLHRHHTRGTNLDTRSHSLECTSRR